MVVETEKITYEVECPADGVLHIVVPAEGEVPVAELCRHYCGGQGRVCRRCSRRRSPSGPLRRQQLPPAAAPATAAAPAAAASTRLQPLLISMSLYRRRPPAAIPRQSASASSAARSPSLKKTNSAAACLNRGCIPTKALLQSAGVYHMAKESKIFGINMTGATVDFPAVMARKATVVKQLVGGLGGISEKPWHEDRQGHGRDR